MAEPSEVFVVSNREYSDGGNLVAFTTEASAKEYVEAIRARDFEANIAFERLQLWDEAPVVITCRRCGRPLRRVPNGWRRWGTWGSYCDDDGDHEPETVDG